MKTHTFIFHTDYIDPDAPTNSAVQTGYNDNDKIWTIAIGHAASATEYV